MAGDFDVFDSDYLNDNWENSAGDDFYAIQADLCRTCGDNVGSDALDPLGRCEVCRAQPARITLDEP